MFSVNMVYAQGSKGGDLAQTRLLTKVNKAEKKTIDIIAELDKMKEDFKTSGLEQPTKEWSQKYLKIALGLDTAMSEADQLRIEHSKLQISKLKGNAVTFAGTDSLAGVTEKWFRSYHDSLGTEVDESTPRRLWYSPNGNEIGVRHLISRESEVAAFRGELTDEQKKRLAIAFPDPDVQPKEYIFGRAAMGFVVHKSNLIKSLSLTQIEDMYRNNYTNWKEVGHFNRPISRVGAESPSLSWGIFLRQVMNNKRVRFPEEKNPPPNRPKVRPTEELNKEMKERWNRYPGHGPFPRYPDKDIMKTVAKNYNAIGYCMVPSGTFNPDVRFIGIKDFLGKSFTPTDDNILSGNYPLEVTFRFFVHPKASEHAKAYVEWLCSEEADSHIIAVGLRPMYQAVQLMADKRLWAYEHGKGTPIRILGPDRQHDLFKALVLDYVTKEDVIRLDFRKHEINELQTSEIYITKSPDSLLNLAEKAGGVFAASAVVPVVHVNNKIRSIAFKQVMGIFKGKKFQRLGYIEGKSLNWYGLFANRPASEAFHEVVLPSHEYLMMKYSKDTDEGIVKVVKDKKALAFFDYSSILQQQNDQIKVINIRTDDGIVKSDKKTIASGKYPIAKPLYIYLDTNASPEAKAFFKHLMAGGSNKTLMEQGYVPVMNE